MFVVTLQCLIMHDNLTFSNYFRLVHFPFHLLQRAGNIVSDILTFQIFPFPVQSHPPIIIILVKGMISLYNIAIHLSGTHVVKEIKYVH